MGKRIFDEPPPHTRGFSRELGGNKYVKTIA